MIEFSDPILGNRWPEVRARDEIALRVAGRDCGGGGGQRAIVGSDHDRRYIWAGTAATDHLTADARGRGACSSHPPTPPAPCADASPPAPPPCAGCAAEDARAAAACAAARCGARGACAARHLGGDLPVADHALACVCEWPWAAPLAERAVRSSWRQRPLRLPGRS